MKYEPDDYWDAGEWHWDLLYNSPSGKYYTQFVHDLCVTILNKYKIKNILDIGGGTGRLAIPLFDAGYSVDVLDIDSKALSELNKKRSEITTILGDIMEYHSEKKYDLILCIGTIKYLDNFDLFLSNATKLLRNHGIILLELINPNCLRRIVAHNIFNHSFSTELDPKIAKQKINWYGISEISMVGLFSIVPPMTMNYSFLTNIAEKIELIFKMNCHLNWNLQYFIIGKKE